jgi:predicted DCC family thiol-disulfide oxidoreductase YuxK
MTGKFHVANRPSKPLLVFDGDCGFCRLWIRRWHQLTGDSVEYAPSQDPRISKQYPEIPADQFAEAVQLINTDGTVVSGAEAVFRTLAQNRSWRWLLCIYESIPLFAPTTEGIYRVVAGHRPAFSMLTRLCWGGHTEQPSFYLVRWLFLRTLGIVYFFAFLSLYPQLSGLIGHNGILPADQLMSAVAQQCDQQGIGLNRFHELPTLCWFNASDGFLHLLCAAGIVLAVLLMTGVAPVLCLFLLWLFFLSLVHVGRDFLGFQWDSLLLETGFLAVFIAPLQWFSRPGTETPPSRMFLWLLRFLLFKLMFSSGCVKLLSGDPNWRNLTALTFHYETQPLPPWTAWYANQLPLWFQKLSCAGTFMIELAAPFLIFAPRRIRFFGAALLACLQTLIMVTGNYAYFNWLALALCLLLLDDFALAKILPRKLTLPFAAPLQSTSPKPLKLWAFLPLAAVALVIFAGSSFMLAMTLGARTSLLKPLAWVAAELEPFRSTNNYGLFAVMTTQRNEIIVEGSNDGTNWLAYEFKYQPGDVSRRPKFIAPFQPRLDWQMWFAALGTYQQNPWFESFCVRLLQGSPDVTALLAKNPFPAHPPKFIRAELYNYRFTTSKASSNPNSWWQRELVGDYVPAVSLRE